jgi:hypothetical protein
MGMNDGSRSRMQATKEIGGLVASRVREEELKMMEEGRRSLD